MGAPVTIAAVPSGYGKWYWPYSLAYSLTIFGPRDGEVDDHKVVIRNARQDERKLQGFGSFRQAQRASRRYEAELVSLGEEAFCERYGIPLIFLA
jgi:hypothetical protein